MELEKNFVAKSTFLLISLTLINSKCTFSNYMNFIIEKNTGDSRILYIIESYVLLGSPF